jgi:hypothetical protein
MIPSFDDRLASVIRALTEVILPHLPPEASLAQEQAHLSIGHLQIMRAQLDHLPGFERDELDDAIAIGRALSSGVSGGKATQAALTDLAKQVSAADGSDVRGQRMAINGAVEGLVRAVAEDGDAGVNSALTRTILQLEHARSQKDRQWNAAFGFDTL